MQSASNCGLFTWSQTEAVQVEAHLSMPLAGGSSEDARRPAFGRPGWPGAPLACPRARVWGFLALYHVVLAVDAARQEAGGKRSPEIRRSRSLARQCDRGPAREGGRMRIGGDGGVGIPLGSAVLCYPGAQVISSSALPIEMRLVHFLFPRDFKK